MEETDISCPYCGETISILVEHSVDNQSYYEDCSVCCCPILFEVIVNDLEEVNIVVKRDDE